MDLQEEKELVEKAKTDEESFVLLYRHYYPQIYRFILKKLGSVQAAEDVTSEVFFRVVKNIGRFQWQGYSFSSWLYKIAVNETNRYFARHKTTVLSSEIALDDVGFWGIEENTPESNFAEKEDVNQKKQNFLLVQKALQGLPEKYREVVALRYLEGKKVSEIAEILEKKEGTVKSLLSRGVEKLANIVDLSLSDAT